MEDNEFDNEDWRRMLRHLGENPDRQGLQETPARVAKAWQHWTSGYRQDPAEILKVFEDGAEKYSELIVVRGIPVYSHCEHHLAPFFGTATVGYTPNGKIVGLSKLTRLVDCFAKRLQVQERLTMQVAESFMEILQPLSVGVVIRCRH
ncbi:MAG: GTP cyclohydrolase I, partial [Janthinobacterium lividum]